MKKAGLVAALVIGAALATALPSWAQFQRYDYIWARSTNGAALTLDGVLNEPQWAQAESLVITSNTIGAIPGSGYKGEGGLGVSDPNRGVFRFLVVDNQLWMGVTVRDSSIGGSALFNRFDGLLMSIKQHQLAARPAPTGEHLISWWWPPESGDTQPLAINKPMSMKGVWRPAWTMPDSAIKPVTAAQLQAWDARYVINGIANSDTLADVGYTIEMRFDLGMNGYNAQQAAGDIVEWNCSLYDMDWFWPVTSLFRYGASRTWIQGPWGGDAWYHNEHILVRPDVTVNTAVLPAFGPDLVIPNGQVFPAPTIDGRLDEPVWARAAHLDIRRDDTVLRASYPNEGAFRSGQDQANVNGGQAIVQDPEDATMKYFYKGTKLYIGLDVRDAVVQSHPLESRWDGGLLSINDRVKRGPDLNLLGHRLSFHIGPAGTLVASDSLVALMTSGAVQAAITLKPGTTLDTLGLDTDTGWQAEFALDLTQFGYPADLGDHAVYLGMDVYDGDSYPVITDSYGTRTWFFRPSENQDGACVAFLDPTTFIATDVGGNLAPQRLELLGNFPNPFRVNTAVRFRLPQPSRVTLEIYDLAGRAVATRDAGLQPAGEGSIPVQRFASRAGVYLYKLRVTDATSGASRGTLTGKMMVLR
jgi:hypothetical protein